ncbi:aminotransferase [Prosthecochloris sp. GSB1]|uniref:DegT/DnrJ/EryC1/StrS family aminotransferase n=1 Tax=Prosthecochloris sp. GSB1 TaxID=281093 RepID=UPI000B8CAE95|nr:DegT/DnrJ/EryC1/StrS aminotransferase family protein [Prosthecochloris sp. GSB1]ASQ89842.1 aminotransferase [Prosthecochloris sp. GSB1]
MTEMVFPPWPAYTEEEADAVCRVLLSNRVNYWTGGEGRAFEEEFAAFCGSEYAIALANGTLALELALKALGIGPGDEVIVPSYTFIATASAVAIRGAVPVVADVDRESLTITAETIAEKMTSRTAGVIPVHLMGHPCDMDPIMSLASEHGLKVVEDCAQAHGARYKGRSVGTIGDAGAWSFCQDKIMTTGGEGGMVTTNDRTLWSKIWADKDHGKSWDAVYGRAHKPGFRWLHESFGTNARMTELQAILGRVQLGRMPEWSRRRRENARCLTDGFMTVPGLRVAGISADIEHAWYKYYVFVEREMLGEGWDRDRIMNAVTARGVPCFSGICPEIYLEKAFGDAGLAPAARLPVARELGETSLQFLVHPTLEERHMRFTSDTVSEIMKDAVVA